MMNSDIAYCSNLKCKNKKCERNQNYIEDKDMYIWISDFPDCKEVTNEDKRVYKQGHRPKNDRG